MGEAGVLGSVEGAAGWRTATSFRASGGGRAVVGGGSGVGVLQLLAPSQSKLVPVLGKRTGWDGQYSKQAECASLDNEWTSIAGR